MNRLVFDFDGVMVDTKPLTLELIRNFIHNFSEDDLNVFMSGNVYTNNFNKDVYNKLKSSDYDFFGEYTKKVIHLNPIKEIDGFIKKYGPIEIVSSQTETAIINFIDKYDLSDNVANVMGVETDKSKVVKLKMLQDKYPDDKIYFITDTCGDILEAHEAGVDAIAVCWGFQPRQLLESSKPKYLVETVIELYQLWEEIKD